MGHHLGTWAGAALVAFAWSCARLPADDGRPIVIRTQTATAQPSSNADTRATAVPPTVAERPVFESETAPLGIASVIALANGGFAASDPDRDALWIVAVGGAAAQRTSFERGERPSRLAQTSDGVLHVVLRGAGSIAHIQREDGAIVGRTRVCANPRGVSALEGSNVLAVACEDGTLARFDWNAPDATLRKRVTERDLRDVAFSGGSLWASTFRSAMVLRFDEESLVERERVALPTQMMTNQPLPWRPSVLWRMIATRAGGVAVSYQLADPNRLTTIDLAPNSPPVYYHSNSASGSTCGALVVSVVALVRAGEAPIVSKPIGQMPLLIDIAENTDEPGLIVLSGTNAIARRDDVEFLNGGLALASISERELRRGANSDPEEPPCARVSDGYLGVHGEGAAIARSARDGTAVFSRDPAGLFINRGRFGATLVRFAGTEPKQDTGHQLFHGGFPAATPSQLACASCHPEGLDDGQVWSFSIGPRRTQHLAGTLADTAPYHWDGDLSTASDIFKEVWSRRMGMAELTPRQSSAAARWLLSLRAAPSEPQAHSEAIARGRAVFESPLAACASCHSGAALSNNQTVDVGTGGALQVPSLRSLARRAPYMHDGCAHTLTERFTNPACGGGDRHGRTSHLDERAVADLVAYMQSL